MGVHKIHRDLNVRGSIQCSTALTVDSGGLTLTAGGLTLTADNLLVSAGTITQTVGNMAVTAGGVDVPVSVGTTATALVNYGLSIIGTTSSTGAKTYTLAAPTIGVEKFIDIQYGSSVRAHKLRASSAGAVTFDGTNHIMTVTTAGDGSIGMHMIGATVTRWTILGTRGTLTYSTS